ncbi:MAG TPA: YciI family protein [Dokdonella sp.]|uniref:YciI family protein n=1 Tax=Dokdonella sp. TaxID=2291710 RepID=UPI002CA6623C|nr:YciI family protein [Dokdonella sp.]HUD40541.1 YciI family protein [Dokdonella sp.]
MSTHGKLFAMAFVFCAPGGVAAADPPPPAAPVHDAALARALGADELGMRHYVLVVLKTGPHKMPAGPERDAMFKGHFANIGRLAAEGKLAVAGPLDGVDGWRGLFILATADLAEAKRLVETDPVVARGEMVAEYHALYSSAALMQVNETHARIARKSP